MYTPSFKERVIANLEYGYGTNIVLGALVGALGFHLFVPDPETSWFTGMFVGGALGALRCGWNRAVVDRDFYQTMAQLGIHRKKE